MEDTNYYTKFVIYIIGGGGRGASSFNINFGGFSNISRFIDEFLIN